MTAQTTLPVPMNDLQLQYERIKSEIDAALAETIANASFILGPQVAAFESAFADYNDVHHCVGVSNGTDALKLALVACGVGPGDEVITTSHTFGATVEAVCDVGARPVFVDIEEDCFTIDVSLIAAAGTAATKALLAQCAEVGVEMFVFPQVRATRMWSPCFGGDALLCHLF